MIVHGRTYVESRIGSVSIVGGTERSGIYTLEVVVKICIKLYVLLRGIVEEDVHKRHRPAALKDHSVSVCREIIVIVNLGCKVEVGCAESRGGGIMIAPDIVVGVRDTDSIVVALVKTDNVLVAVALATALFKGDEGVHIGLNTVFPIRRRLGIGAVGSKLSKALFNRFDIVLNNVSALILIVLVLSESKRGNDHTAAANRLPVVGTLNGTPSVLTRSGYGEVTHVINVIVAGVPAAVLIVGCIVLDGVVALHHTLAVEDVSHLVSLLGLVIERVVDPVKSDSIRVGAVGNVEEVSLSPVLPLVKLDSVEVECVCVLLLLGDLPGEREILHHRGKGVYVGASAVIIAVTGESVSELKRDLLACSSVDIGVLGNADESVSVLVIEVVRLSDRLSHLLALPLYLASFVNSEVLVEAVDTLSYLARDTVVVCITVYSEIIGESHIVKLFLIDKESGVSVAARGSLKICEHLCTCRSIHDKG